MAIAASFFVFSINFVPLLPLFEKFGIFLLNKADIISIALPVLYDRPDLRWYRLLYSTK